MKCKHENNPVDTHIVLQSLSTDGSQLVARRQCSICNQTLEQLRPLPENFDKNGIDAFYDWDAGSWEPVSQHQAYQERQAKKIAPPPAKADPEPAPLEPTQEKHARTKRPRE